jgi:hypothetical protein
MASQMLMKSASAAPSLTISNLGANLSGNLEWLVEVAPDPARFTSTDLGLGGSLAVELALEVNGSSLVGATVNHTDWPFAISGNNPFTNTVTSGINLDLTNETLFASLLSDFFIAATAVEVLTIETSGISCTTLSWGGHTVLGGTADEYEGSLIAQSGQNFTAYRGSLTEPDVGGDFDADCDVDGADFIEWQRHYAAPYTGADLADFEMNFGTVAPIKAAPIQAISAALPEPSTSLLLASLLFFTLKRCR